MIPFELFRIPPRRGSGSGRISIITRPSALHERFGGSFGHWERWSQARSNVETFLQISSLFSSFSVFMEEEPHPSMFFLPRPRRFNKQFSVHVRNTFLSLFPLRYTILRAGIRRSCNATNYYRISCCKMPAVHVMEGRSYHQRARALYTF